MEELGPSGAGGGIQGYGGKQLASTVPYLSVIEKMDYFDSYSTYEKLLRIDIDLSKIYDVIVRERDYLDMYLVNENNEIIMSASSGYERGNTAHIRSLI